MKYLLAFLLLASPAFAQKPADFRAHVEKLATFDGRKAGSEGCDRAAEYLTGTLTKYGLKVQSQGFEYKGYKTKNLVAVVGSGPEYIVVGAHYDGQGPNHPGADDNASGTAEVLELARVFKKTPAWRSLAFILFSAEEDGLIGSQFYTSHPMLPEKNPDLKKHVFMVNLDMVGCLVSPKRAGKLPSVLDSLTIRYPFARDVTLQGNDDSDNYSFAQKGVQAIFIHTGGHDRYHKPTDTPASLNYEGMVQIHQYVEDLIRALSVVNLPDKNLKFEAFKYEP